MHVKKLHIDSYFSYNYGLYDASEYYLNNIGFGHMAYVHMQIAGALRLLVESLSIKECYFFENSNLKGGAIYVNKNENSENTQVSIENCIFNMNEAGDNGGAISFDKNIILLQGNITNCYFESNHGWCM